MKQEEFAVLKLCRGEELKLGKARRVRQSVASRENDVYESLCGVAPTPPMFVYAQPSPGQPPSAVQLSLPMFTWPWSLVHIYLASQAAVKLKIMAGS